MATPELYWLVLMCVVCHIIDDFHIQGCLADLKQKEWWTKNVGQAKYSHDHIIALLWHGLEWSFIVHLPFLIFYGLFPSIFISVILNALLHAGIDHLKCNMHLTNLWQDQLLHLAQIVLITVFCYQEYLMM